MYSIDKSEPKKPKKIILAEISSKERASLKQSKMRKTISFKAHQQLKSLIMLDEGENKVTIAEEVGISYQTLKKWILEFNTNRFKTLLANDKKNKKYKGDNKKSLKPFLKEENTKAGEIVEDSNKKKSI